MRLIIVRHGETEYNVRGVFQGQGIDAPLSEHGRRQAERVAARLAREPIVRAYSSDLMRAKETAETILRGHHCKLHTTPALRERAFGIYEGRQIPQEGEARQRLYDELFHSRPEGGESMSDVAARVEKFLVSTVLDDADEIVLIVAHGVTNKLILKTLLNLSMTEARTIQQGNTCVNVVDYHHGRHAMPLLINCSDHLSAEVPA